MKKQLQKLLAAALSVVMLGGCAGGTMSAESQASASPQTAESTANSETTEAVEKTGDIIVLYTSDIHCGLNQGFGAVGLAQVRNTLEKNGNEVLLVDDGDAIQGDAIGILTKGQAVTKVMNALRYDVAIPGNHEFDYGFDEFETIVELADFPYISCNITKYDELLLDPYVIKEAEGKKIAFIGVTTPVTISTSNPVHFQDEDGNYIIGFTQDKDGSALFAQVQKYIDEVRGKGADYVFLICHMGHDESDAPYNFQTLIENTEGVNVVLDGHSHDTDQVEMNDKNGNPVLRSACGTKLQGIGYAKISGKDGSVETGLYTWNNEQTPAELFDFTNEVDQTVQDVYDAMADTMNEKVADSDVTLSIYDPVEKDSAGNPVRISRKMETNMADIITDAFRVVTGAEISFVNAGSLRDTIKPGEVTYGDIIRVLPFSNAVSVSKIKGELLLDALEWCARGLPRESSILMPSGFTYEIDATIPSSVSADVNGQFGSIDGARRVSNVMINGEPLDPEKYYTVAATSYLLYEGGSGLTLFDHDMVTMEDIKLDNECLIEYVQKHLDGVIGEEYENIYGQGRLVVKMPE